MRKTLVSLLTILILLNTIFSASLYNAEVNGMNNYFYGNEQLLNYTWIRTIMLQAPAVSSGNIGIFSNITLVLAYPGRGIVYFTALPFTELDTQITIRTAAWIASIIAGVRFDRYDYYVLMKAEYPIIGGPSAGALVATGFLSLLLNTSILPNVTMTGTINPDGTIGPVGGLMEKIEVASRNGYKVFLIPSGQRLYTYPVVYEERFLWGVIKRVEYRTIDLVEYGRSLNISVIEVGSVLEAFRIATGFKISVVENIVFVHYNLLDKLVRNNSLTLFNKISRDLETVKELISRVKNPYDKYILENMYNTLLGKYYMLKKSFDNNKTFYSLIESLKLSASVFRLIWFLKIYNQESTIDYLIDYINNTLNNVLVDLNESINYINSFEDLVIFSMAYACFKTSSFYMINAINAYRSGDIDATLSNIENVLYYINQCELFIKLLGFMFNQGSRTIKISRSLINQIYSTALSSYTYAYTLSSETSLKPYTLGTLSVLYSSLLEEKNVYSVIGNGLFIMAYSSSTIHLIFSKKYLNNTIYFTKDIINRYLYLVNNLTVIEELFYRSSLEYIENNDYENALIHISIVNALLQIRINNYVYEGEVINLPTLNPINYEYNIEKKPSVNPSSFVYSNISHLVLVVFLLIIITALVSLIIIIYIVIYRSKLNKIQHYLFKCW